MGAKEKRLHLKLLSELKKDFAEARASENPDTTPSTAGLPLKIGADVRFDSIIYKKWKDTKDSATIERELNEVADDGGLVGSIVPYLRYANRKEQGNKKFAAGKYEDAIGLYLHAMRALLGDELELPTKVFFNETYKRVLKRQDSFKEVIDLAACATNIAQCYIKMFKIAEALEWIEEVNVIYLVFKALHKPEEPSWSYYHITMLEYVSLRLKTFLRGIHVFELLQNTGNAVAYGTCANTLAFQWADADNGQTIKAMQSQIRLLELSAKRHPDPATVYEQELVYPDLQTRGTWKKLTIKSDIRPPARQGFASWVWGGRLYVMGGNGTFEQHEDLWCLDFKTLRWRQLSSLPKKDNNIQRWLTHWQMRVWKDIAVLFNGRSDFVWTFDLVKEKWAKKHTKMKGKQKWPYSKTFVSEYCAAVLEGRLYIFGGDDGNTSLGTNVLLALNLETFVWDHISGTSDHIPTPFEPNLRRFAQMWAVPEHRKLYLLFGNAARMNARYQGKDWGLEDDYAYDDFWSFDVGERKWSRERLNGNYPCPRSEAAAVYNPKLKKAFVYGGYNACLSSAASETMMFNYSFFGDTFMFDPETKRWKHVLTRGFPSYRATAHLVVNPETGKTYLYGGYTNPDYVPSKSSGAARCFGDVWQLKLDMEGGDLTEEDIQKDVNSETLGPWRRCFSCGSFGTMMMKCAGTCDGQYYFCSTECQRESWKEHRDTHGCRRRQGRPPA